jgi:hypothetical protein
MGLKDGLKIHIFPKFVPIAQLAIVKTLIVIVVQGMEIDIPVIGEVIGKTIVPSVAITKKDEL